MTRKEAVWRLREDIMDQLYNDEHMMTVKEVANWLYKHNCDEDAMDVLMEIIGGQSWMILQKFYWHKEKRKSGSGKAPTKKPYI